MFRTLLKYWAGDSIEPRCASGELDSICLHGSGALATFGSTRMPLGQLPSIAHFSIARSLTPSILRMNRDKRVNRDKCRSYFWQIGKGQIQTWSKQCDGAKCHGQLAFGWGARARRNASTHPGPWNWDRFAKHKRVAVGRRGSPAHAARKKAPCDLPKMNSSVLCELLV